MELGSFFKSEKISNTVTRISGITQELMYLVEGTDRAVLIDTGIGVGNLKTFVEKLTDKPMVVLLSHGHMDHALGASVFDEVYMNLQDMNVYHEHGESSMRKDYIKMNIGERFSSVQESDYILPGEVEFKPLNPGDEFALGGITLEIFEAKGHTPGSLAILFKEERTLFLGDACNYFTFLFDENSIPVEAYKKKLEKLHQDTEGRYDKVYLSHDGGDAPKEMITSVIQVCQDIMDGNVDDMPMEFMGYTACVAKATAPSRRRKDGGIGNIVYNKERIFQ